MGSARRKCTGHDRAAGESPPSEANPDQHPPPTAGIVTNPAAVTAKASADSRPPEPVVVEPPVPVVMVPPVPVVPPLETTVPPEPVVPPLAPPVPVEPPLLDRAASAGGAALGEPPVPVLPPLLVLPPEPVLPPELDEPPLPEPEPPEPVAPETVSPLAQE